jgi:DNA (cytosine-5)-methyltransferase 1
MKSRAIGMINRHVDSKKPSAVSLFTGAGGLDLGLEVAGFDVRVAIEVDADCVGTLRRNRDWPVIDRSIHDIHSEEILARAELGLEELDLLVGGPPCQPFSKSGYWANGDTKRLDDPRATTLSAFLRVMRHVRPRAYLIENVAGLSYSEKDQGLRFVTETIREINRSCGTDYTCDLLLLNSVDFGVPQIRERAFIMGARDGSRFGRLKPTHFPPSEDATTAQSSLRPDPPIHRTAWDALWDLEDDDSEDLVVTGKWADLLPSIPEGKNYLYHTGRGGGLPLFGWRRRFWNFLLKLAKNLPSWTITATPGPATGPFHWKNRRLSVRELCRLQTFPDGYAVVGTYKSVLRQIGNAVPCALAEILGIEIRRRLLKDEASQALKPTLIPEKRFDAPTPDPVKAVPEKYRELVGIHEPHPGTGKGYAATRRAADQKDLILVG